MTFHVERELARQPEAWRAVTERTLPPEVLPEPGERVAVVGCGTSLYMARCVAACREAAGHGVTDAFSASLYPFGRTYDRVVAITRSGTTTEVLQVLERLGPEANTTVVTVADGLAAGDLARHVVTLPMAEEQSVVQTVFPTTVLAMFRHAVGESLDRAISEAERNLTAELPVEPGAPRQITFLGTGWAVGIADEAALKCREAAGAWTESYPSMEYRHGPIAVSGPDTVVWAFGVVPAGLAEDVASTGAGFVSGGGDPMADLIRAQRLAVAAAVANGRDPDEPRGLSFSVVLDERQLG